MRENLFEEVARLFHDLDEGMTPLSVFLPHAPVPAHFRRDKVRLTISMCRASLACFFGWGGRGMSLYRYNGLALPSLVCSWVVFFCSCVCVFSFLFRHVVVFSFAPVPAHFRGGKVRVTR